MGRGIDFKGVNLVINYDFPTSSVAYIHRIGMRHHVFTSLLWLNDFVVDIVLLNIQRVQLVNLVSKISVNQSINQSIKWLTNQSINHKGKRSYKQMKSFTLPSRVSDERIFPNISLRCFIVSFFVFLFKVEQAVLVDQEKLWHFSQRTMQQICAGTNRAFISQQRFQIWAVLTFDWENYWSAVHKAWRSTLGQTPIFT